MTKKHFIKFAKFIANYSSGAVLDPKKINQFIREDMARMIIDVAGDDNPRFDENRFREACGLT